MTAIDWEQAHGDFTFFVHNFVRKEKRDRWLFLTRKGWNPDIIWRKLNQLEGTLDQKVCTQITDYSLEKCFSILQKRKFALGTLFSTREYPQKIEIGDLILLETNYHGWFLSCPKEQLGFFNIGEGWYWICDPQKQ